TPTLGVHDRRRQANAPLAEQFPGGGARGHGNYKGARELILEGYAAAFGFELIMLGPANVFGLGHFWSGSSGGQKMHNLIVAGLDGTRVRVPASETVANEYGDAKDVGRA